MRLCSLVRIYMAFKGYKFKALAEEIGISTRELRSLVDGKSPSGAVLTQVTQWMWAAENGEQKPSEAKKEGGLFNG